MSDSLARQVAAPSRSVRLVRYTGLYAVLLVLHLLGVVFAIGPLGVTAVAAGRLVREGDVAALTRAARVCRDYALGSIVVVGLGTAMLDRKPTRIPRSAAWVSASYALWLVAVVLTLAVVVPTLRKAAAEASEGRPADRLAVRVGAAGGVAMLCWIAIIVLMVVKPT